MKKYYTVEQVAELLAMHPKTIQRYIREGKLSANKVGKSWRIPEQEFKRFAEKPKAKEDSDTEKKQAVASAVVDIPVRSFEEASKIEKLLVAALNSKPGECGRTTMHVQHLEYEDMVRVTLWGNLLFMQSIFDLIFTVTEQAEL